MGYYQYLGVVGSHVIFHDGFAIDEDSNRARGSSQDINVDYSQLIIVRDNRGSINRPGSVERKQNQSHAFG